MEKEGRRAKIEKERRGDMRRLRKKEREEKKHKRK